MGRLHLSMSEQATSRATSPWSKNFLAITHTALLNSLKRGNWLKTTTDFW